MEDVEELMKATAENADDGMSSLRERIRERLETAKSTLAQGKRVLETLFYVFHECPQIGKQSVPCNFCPTHSLLLSHPNSFMGCKRNLHARLNCF